MSQVVVDQFPYNRSPFNVPTRSNKVFYCPTHGRIYDIQGVGSTVLKIGGVSFCRMCYASDRELVRVFQWGKFGVKDVSDTKPLEQTTKTEVVSLKRPQLPRPIPVGMVKSTDCHTSIPPRKGEEKKIQVPFIFRLVFFATKMCIFTLYIITGLIILYFAIVFLYVFGVSLL